MFNKGIYRFNLSPAQLKKIDNQPKAEEKTEKPVEQKVEAQKPHDPNVMSSTKALEVLAAMQNAVVNTPKTQAPENVAPKQKASGARTETTEEVDENGDKIVITKKYDNAGRLVSETYYKNGILEKEYSVEYVNGRKKYECTKYYNENGKPTHYTSIDYDSLGVFVGKNEGEYYENGNLKYRTTTKEYDEKGNPLSSHTDYYDENGVQTGCDWKDYTYEYDENGNLISKTTEANIDEYPYEYTLTEKYDENGNLIYKKISSPCTNNTNYNYVEEYEYYENGVLASKTTQISGKKTVEEYNENGVLVYKEEIFDYGTKTTKTYDENGNLTFETIEKYDSNNDLTYKSVKVYGENGVLKSEYTEDYYMHRGLSEGIKRLITKKEYDDYGNLISCVTEFYDRAGKLKEVTVDTYDEQGNHKEVSTRFNEDGSKTVTVKINNKKLNETIEKYDKDGNLVEQKITEYNEKGDLLSEITKKYDKDGNLVEQTITERKYNEKGDLLSGITKKYDKDGNLVEQTIKECEYNEKGDLLSEITKKYDKDGNLIGLETTECEYDEKGHLINRTHLYYNEKGEIVESYITKRNYDEAGNFLRYEYEHIKNGEVLEKEIEEYQYDENGNKTSWYYEHYKKGQYHRITTREYVYDGNERIGYKEKSSECYYDEQGRVTEEYVNERDLDGSWTDTTIEYEYSLLGMKKTTTVENPDGTSSVTEEKQDRKGNVTSKVTYYYDEDGNLVDTVVEVEDKTSKNKINPDAINLGGSKIDFGNLKNNKIER